MSFGISVGDILKLCELAGRVYKNCRDCTGEYKSLTTEARSLSNLLEDIQDKHDKIPDNKRQQLVDACEPCIEVLQELDAVLLHYNTLDTKSKRAWDRLKWDPERFKAIRDRLTASVSMLNTFYTSLIHDSQVLILEALERLEHDYRGGHREESIASIERITSDNVQDEGGDDDAAWSQILRDLEDVGVSQQEALRYRDVIVDWLVAAVNEGRLLEQRPEPDSFQSLPQDLRAALPISESMENQGAYGWNDPITLSLAVRNSFASSPVRVPSLNSPMSHQQSEYLNPSMASPPVSGRSSTSLDDRVLYADANASPPQARSQPLSEGTQPARLGTHEFRRDPGLLSNAPYVQAAASPLLTASHHQTTPSSTSSASELPTFISPSSIVPPPTFFASPASIQPPAYDEKASSTTIDIEWTGQQILAAWSRYDFLAAGQLLESQLAAVERGQTMGSGTQPDRRILKYLIGIVCSFTGDFLKAKRCFEGVVNGIYLDRANLDDGDIAAARWLGDVCLHLREHENAVLAYSVAYEGSIGRYGAARDRTRRVAQELLLLDHWLNAFRRIEQLFHLNSDPTDIFSSTHGMEKSNLIVSVKGRLYAMNSLDAHYLAPPFHQGRQPSYLIGMRPKLDLMLSETFVLKPLISLSAWPLPWDPTFSPTDAVQLDRYMNTIPVLKAMKPLVDRSLPTAKLGDSKKLHYVTKRGSRWLIETVKKGLQDLGIEHAENGYETSIVCCLNQHREGFAFSEGVKIGFTKLQFRSVYGIKISDILCATRRFPASSSQDTTDFRNIIKGILGGAEADESDAVPHNGAQPEDSRMYPLSPHAPFVEKRPAFG
ncbi:hypothetical protein BKA66DRAFT_408005 [Pyrenochaeta sp. MPI-SDFR-AT-0127]|nr:hypothetical protein BKA66DRAFT_408005 [Pyrenochaeta sp. MPI-SDFR-AT-0127]